MIGSGETTTYLLVAPDTRKQVVNMMQNSDQRWGAMDNLSNNWQVKAFRRTKEIYHTVLICDQQPKPSQGTSSRSSAMPRKNQRTILKQQLIVINISSQSWKHQALMEQCYQMATTVIDQAINCSGAHPEAWLLVIRCVSCVLDWMPYASAWKRPAALVLLWL